jgi:hypothetical protein
MARSPGGYICHRPDSMTPPGWIGPGCPPEERRDLTKGQIALEVLDQARADAGRGW